WRELCELWSSDYRTHITDARWNAYEQRLLAGDRPQTPDNDWNGSPGDRREEMLPGSPAIQWNGPLLTIRTEAVTLVLNCRRGLAIHSLAFGDDVSLCGTLAHGYYDDIHWGADFYSGMTVMEVPGRSKLTDLNRVEARIGRTGDGDLVIEGSIPTDFGPVRKTIRVSRREKRVAWTYRLEW